MEPTEKRTEEVAGQIAANVDSVETPVTDQADEAQVEQDDTAEVTAETTDDSTETIENIVEEAVVESTEEETVVESTPVILTETDTDATETGMTEMSATTGQSVEPSDSASCPWDGCPNWARIGGGILVIAIIAAIIIKLLRKKTDDEPTKKPNGKPNDAAVVEIYAGNLSYDMNDNQLRKEFERFGVVKSARVITHRTNNKSKGYGFVEMPHRKEALIAIKALENADVMGRRIRVNEARANTRPSDR